VINLSNAFPGRYAALANAVVARAISIESRMVEGYAKIEIK
jgi:hypothetical protein